MNIAFIGLGIMGSRMAANLLKNGHPLTVYNRTRSGAEALEPLGAIVADSIGDAVRQADIVFTMLSNPPVVEAIAFGEEGLLSSMKTHALWVDCSTINPAFARQMADAAQVRKLRYLEAPVAGSAPQAEAAALAFFVGGAAADLQSVHSLLEVMGAKILHTGAAGMGAALKLLVNAMLAQSMVVFAETLLLGERLGLDKSFLLDFLPGLPVIAPFTKAKSEMIRADSYPVQFPLEHMQKDLQLAAQTAYEVGSPLYLANLAKELYAGAKAAGLARADFSAIYQYLAK